MALLTAIAVALPAVVACGEVEEREVPGRASLLTPDASVAATPAPSPSPSPGELSAPPEGYTWREIPANADFGLLGYAVQIPANWITPSVTESPVHFFPQESTSPTLQLLTMVTPVSAGFQHPILFNLPQMGTTCGSGVPQGALPGFPERSDVAPAEQFAGDAHTWNVYYFSCETRLTSGDVAAGKAPSVFQVRGAEVRAGEFIFSVTAFEPMSTAAAQTSFEQALRSFRQR